MSGLQELLTGLFDTKLDPRQEAAFQQWARAKNRLGDLEDYDMRGAWQANVGQSGNGHYPDTYKKPNHPTFSTESQYSTPQHMGGTWQPAGGDSWVYWASPQNLEGRGVSGLADYFRRVEPDSTVVFPSNYRLPRK